MRVVCRMSAIVAALTIAIAGGVTLAGCGQRGPLYLPTVPPLPPKPGAATEAPRGATSDAQASSPAAGNAPSPASAASDTRGLSNPSQNQ